MKAKVLKHSLLVVGIPVYNEELYIEESLNSLANQEWTKFAVLIGDNNSSDKTEEICRRVVGKDSRFHYVRHSHNLGSSGNARWLLEVTESPYFMWFGAHDKLAPAFIQEHLRALEAKPECSLSYSLTQWIDLRGNSLRVTDPSEMGEIAGSPLSRYITSVRQLRECTPINSIFRRKMFGEDHDWNVMGADKLMLSELLFRGPAHRVGRPQYLRREFPPSHKTGYMERLTGGADAVASEEALAEAYLASFDRLMSGRVDRLLWRFWLRLHLERYITYNPKVVWLARAAGMIRRSARRAIMRFLPGRRRSAPLGRA